jgi:glycosyltransferase involved in cell wall biosynthesis
MPSISIIMPVYNAAPYLSACLESIIGQRYVDFELLAVNDGSRDDSWDILQEFASQDERIQVYQNKDKGIVPALQLGYAQSSGDYIHRMDADDIMPKNKLELLLENCPEEGAVTGHVQYFSDDWLVGPGFRRYEEWLNATMDHKNWEPEMFKECILPSPAWMMSRKTFEKIGAFKTVMLPEDYDLCFRVFENNLEINTVPEVVHLWRDHQSRTSRKDPRYFPKAYFRIKVHYFLKLKYHGRKPLILWGAGNKGKEVAKHLLDAQIKFRWVTQNEEKIGKEIYGVWLEALDLEEYTNCQLILAMSSPDDQSQVNEELKKTSLMEGIDFWWFC